MDLTRRSRIFSIVAALYAIASLCAASTNARAQGIETDTTHWNDEDLYTETSAPAFFSVGGGVLGGYFKPNLTDLNKNIAQPFVGNNLTERVWMLGGQGFISVPWVKNLRVGGMGYGGATSCNCMDTTIDGASVNRMLEYSVGYGALTLDYVLPLRTGRFHIVPGIALGLGSVNIYMQQAANRLNFDVTEFNKSSPYITHTYTSHFFLYMPQIQFEYAPLGFMMVRLSAGYQGTAMGTWTVDRGVGLGSTDALNTTNGSGLIANLGIFFGLFQ